MKDGIVAERTKLHNRSDSPGAKIRANTIPYVDIDVNMWDDDSLNMRKSESTVTMSWVRVLSA
jgi:hypothetical protein